MNETNEPMAGAGARLLAEIIKTPAFAELIKINAFELEPESAASFVHTLLWQDSALALSMAGAIPLYINYLAEAALELGRSLSTFPQPLLEDFLTRIIDGIDTGKIARVPDTFQPLSQTALGSERLRQRVADSVQSSVNALFKASVSMMSQLETSPAGEGLDAQVLGQAVTLAARAFNRRVARDPYVLRDILKNADGDEVLRAAKSAAIAVGICFFSAAASLISAAFNVLRKTAGTAGRRAGRWRREGDG